MTASQRIVAATGGPAEDYADAFEPPLSPPPLKSCTVLLRVVRAVTLEPLRSGLQVAIDTTSGMKAPKEEFGMGNDGRIRFISGQFREVTDQLRDGVLRIPNPPAHFRMYVNVMNGSGGGEGLVYTQCFRPETVLLVTGDPARPKPEEPPKELSWLWVKSGKMAELSAPAAAAPASASAAVGMASPEFRVTAVKAADHPENYSGTCPTGDMAFNWAVTSNGSGTAVIRFTQESRPIREETVSFSGPGTKVVTYRPAKMGAPGGHYQGWIGFEVLAPNKMTADHEAYTMQCAPRIR